MCTVVKVCLEIYHEFDSPASLYLSTGNYALWLRYGEWLLTCPVSSPQLAMQCSMLATAEADLSCLLACIR